MDRRFALAGVDARTQIVRAAPLLLLAKAKPLFALESAARAGADMDAVHDMRVASRRLREAMRLLEPLYPRKRFRAWYRSVRTITRALGPVRDSDVFIDAFSRLGPELSEGGRRFSAFLIGQRMGRREYELVLLNEALAALDLKASRREFKALVHDLAPTGWAKRPFVEFAHAEVASRAAVVFGAQPAALDEANINEQHALRIDYKRLRYAVEAFAPCYGEYFDSLHQTLTEFQDTLGDLHDLHVFLDSVRAPGAAEAAASAGVSRADVAEVEAVLESRAHDMFARFTGLATDFPPDALLPALLLPLAQSATTVRVGATDRVESSGVPEAAAVVSEVLEAADGPDAASVFPPVIDVDGSVLPPVIVGEEPWAVGWDAVPDADLDTEESPAAEPGT
ncbi:MAG: CHAD domain-containing protein [Coriobacteriia bacterium]|nr:CHAD domain-containing protein [Coriobacteriia bacterium]